MLVGNALFGVIVASANLSKEGEKDGGGTEDDGHKKGGSSKKDPVDEPPNNDVPMLAEGYMIPIEDVFRSISTVLSVTARLPTLVDWRIAHLRAQRRPERWSTQLSSDRDAKLAIRHMEMELLLVEQKLQSRVQAGGSVLGPTELSPSLPSLGYSRITLDSIAPPPRELGRIDRSILKHAGDHFHSGTVGRLLLLGDVWPLTAGFRDNVMKWIKRYRHPRLRLDAAAAHIVLEQCIQTRAGENLISMILFLSYALQAEGVAAWVPKLLSSLYGALRAPATATPRFEYIQQFVNCVLGAYKDKALTGLEIEPGASRDPQGGETNRSGIMTLLPDRDEVDTWLAKARVPRLTRKQPRAADVEAADEESEKRRPDRYKLSWSLTVADSTRLFVLMHRIAPAGGGSGKEVLVLGGPGAVEAGAYASVALGPGVEFRGADPVSKGLSQTGRLTEATDVIVFPESPQTLCEVIDREERGLAQSIAKKYFRLYCDRPGSGEVGEEPGTLCTVIS